MDSKVKPVNMKRRGYFLLYSDIDTIAPDGIERKILCQKRMFEELGIQMEFKVLKKHKGTFWNDNNELSDVDFIYFRKSTIIDWSFVRFFRKLKMSANPLVFMEIPTYPYEGEYGKSCQARLKLNIDKLFRSKLQGLIDRIVVTGYEVGEKLWGIPSISIVNGIDLTSVKPRNCKKHDGFVLGCIAKFSPWHGYERLIKGLADYYSKEPNKEVRLLMVGEGEEKPYYEKLVWEYKLSNYVDFTGKLTGDSLNEIYDRIDVGICSLGRYKSCLDVIGDLKSREFMAKGIPMICGCQIDVLQGIDYPYALFVPNDDSTVNINDILDFNDMLMDTYSNVTGEIRKEAERLVDFSSTYKKVVDSVKEAL